MKFKSVIIAIALIVGAIFMAGASCSVPVGGPECCDDK